jgi:choline transport protein
MAEEIPHAARNVPIAMVGSVVANGVLGFIYCLVLLFGLGDLASLLETTTGFPFMQLFLNVTNSRAGAIVMSLVPTVIAVLATAAGLASTSRTFWAFARDDAVPAPKFWSHVDKRLKIPVRMILLVFLLQLLLGLLYLGSTTAFNAVLSMAVIGMYLSYALPIVYMFFCGRGSHRVQAAPFRMSHGVGAAVNVVALVWLVLAMFFSVWPNFYPVTPETMNYSIVVLVGWIVVGGFYYGIWGRKIYDGPVLETVDT